MEYSQHTYPVHSPMSSVLISPEQLEGLTYPLYVSPKLNGIRAYFDYDGVLRTKSRKLIPNAYIRSTLGGYSNLPLDGEVIAGDTFEETKSNVMTDYKKCIFTFYVFDWISKGIYSERLADLMLNIDTYTKCIVKVIRPFQCFTPNEVLEAYNRFAAEPYPSGEGIVLRSRRGLYKPGRSTVIEQYALKMKAIETDTAIIAEVVPLVEGGVTRDAVGSLRCVMPGTGHVFHIGTGFEVQQRYELFQKGLVGRTVTYSYLPACSKDGLPSQAVFVKLGEL